MATHIKYSEAERESFKIVPETCPAVERAIDKAFEQPSFRADDVAAIFKKYDIELSLKVCDAMHEVIGRMLFDRKMALKDVVLYQGTFPLRAALVNELHRSRGYEMDRNRFEEWIEFHGKVQSLRAA